MRINLIRTLLLCVLVSVPGCPPDNQAGGLGRKPATPAQLQAAYPQLASGRFVVLHDFNTDGQLAAISAGGFRIASGRSATGGGAAVAQVAASESIRVQLHRGDWRDYTLLLLSIRVDRAMPLGVQLQAAGKSWRGERTLSSGWNLLTLDLEEAGMQLKQEALEALVLTPREASEVALDDLLLANDRQELPPPSSSFALRTETAGLRVTTGVPGRFGLTLQSGVIVDWRGTADVALGGSQGLGVWRVPASGDGGVPLPPATLRGGQRVLESGFRTVVEAKHGRWTIYAHGAAYLSLPDSADDQVTLLSVIGNEDFAVLPGPPLQPDTLPLGLCLLQQEGSEADLLWVPSRPGSASGLRERFSPGSADLLVRMDGRSQSHMLQTALDELDADAAEALAAAYQHPPRPDVSTGSLRRDAEGDRNGDGFNEGEGCYELRARDQRLRMRLTPEEWPLSNPVFRVQGVEGKRCWVYANGRIVTELGRDAEGALLFVLTGTHQGPLTIEVTGVSVAG